MLDKFQQVTREVPQLQFIDTVWFSSLTTETGTQGQTVETVEIPQLQFLDKLFMGFGVLQYIEKEVDVLAMQRSPRRPREKSTLFLREGDSGSRVAPVRWTIFLRAPCSGRD